MSLDLEKYRHYVEGFNLTKAQEDELLLTVWSMMEAGADRAFGLHPVQQCKPKQAEKDLQPPTNTVDSGDPPMYMQHRDLNDNDQRKGL